MQTLRSFCISGLKHLAPILLAILCTPISCSSPHKELIISRLSPYETVEKLGDKMQKYDYYLVQNFEFGHLAHVDTLKKFAATHVDPDCARYALYVIVFYKESSATNIQYKETPQDLILWHGADILYTFEWNEGKFTHSFAYKDGRIIP